MKADRHPIYNTLHPRSTVTWLAKYGYRALPCIPIQGQWNGGIVFARPGEPVQMAVIGDTLRYDGRKKVVIVEYPISDGTSES